MKANAVSIGLIMAPFWHDYTVNTWCLVQPMLLIVMVYYFCIINSVTTVNVIVITGTLVAQSAALSSMWYGLPGGGGGSLSYWGQNKMTEILQTTFSNLFLAATKQLYEWLSPSVCLSVTPFSLCSHHRIIIKFSGVITNDRSDVHAKGQGQRSKVKVTEVTTQLNRFRTVTPVWVHKWWWNDA